VAKGIYRVKLGEKCTPKVGAWMKMLVCFIIKICSDLILYKKENGKRIEEKRRRRRKVKCCIRISRHQGYDISR